METTREEMVQEFFKNSAILKRLASVNFCQSTGISKLSPTQSEILYIVSQKRSLNLKEMANLMLLTPGAITQLVENLVKAGYLNREHSASDRRVQLLSLSKEGSVVMNQLKKYHRKTSVDMAMILSNEELEVMRKAQHKMIEYYTKQQTINGSKSSKIAAAPKTKHGVLANA